MKGEKKIRKSTHCQFEKSSVVLFFITSGKITCFAPSPNS